MAETIRIGANKVLAITLKDVANANLPLTSLTDLEVWIVQYNRKLSILNYKPGTAAPELTVGTQTYILNVEITKEISSKFKEGDVYIDLRSEQTDVLFVVDGVFADPRESLVLTATL